MYYVLLYGKYRLFSLQLPCPQRSSLHAWYTTCLLSFLRASCQRSFRSSAFLSAVVMSIFRAREWWSYSPDEAGAAAEGSAPAELSSKVAVAVAGFPQALDGSKTELIITGEDMKC